MYLIVNILNMCILKWDWSHNVESLLFIRLNATDESQLLWRSRSMNDDAGSGGHGYHIYDGYNLHRADDRLAFRSSCGAGFTVLSLEGTTRFMSIVTSSEPNEGTPREPMCSFLLWPTNCQCVSQVNTQTICSLGVLITIWSLERVIVWLGVLIRRVATTVFERK